MKEEAIGPLRDYAGRMINDSSNYHQNLNQDFIFTTEDKIRLSLISHLGKIEKKKAWITPLGMFITILIIFPTTTFKSFLSIPDTTWEAIFMISGFICFCWFCYSILKSKSSSIDDVIREIKQTKESVKYKSNHHSVTELKSLSNKKNHKPYIEVEDNAQFVVNKKEQDALNKNYSEKSQSARINGLLLESGLGDNIISPSLQIIKDLLISLPAGDNCFVILSRLNSEYFVQTLRVSETFYFLEYQDGSLEKHYDSIEPNLDINKIIKAFESFAMNDDSWEKDLAWSLMDESEILSKVTE